MKSVLAVAVACSVLALAGIAQADTGMPSSATLNAMGLSGIQVLSDAEADSVRGMGYYGYKPSSNVIAYGKSYAHVGGYGAKAGTKDGYYAEGYYYAKGRHGSHAKIEVKKGSHRGRRGNHGGGHHGGGNHGGGNHGGGNHGGGHHKTVKVYAGGYAYASAK